MHTLALLTLPPAVAGLLLGAMFYFSGDQDTGGVFGGPALPALLAGIVAFAVAFVIMMIVVVVLDLTRAG